MNMTETCPECLENCLLGDPEAWRNLFAQARPLIGTAVRYTLARHGLRDPADVEDVCQEVLYRLLLGERRLLATYDPQRGSFRTWLAVVSRSTAMDFLRRRESATHLPLDEAELTARDPDIAEQVLELPSGVLSPRQRTVLRMLFEQGLDAGEIAQQLDIHPQTVRSLRHSGLAKLKQHYAH